MVGKEGFEPSCLSAHDPKSCLSANSSTPPKKERVYWDSNSDFYLRRVTWYPFHYRRRAWIILPPIWINVPESIDRIDLCRKKDTRNQVPMHPQIHPAFPLLNLLQSFLHEWPAPHQFLPRQKRILLNPVSCTASHGESVRRRFGIKDDESYYSNLLREIFPLF